jgi:hypothetical protein
VSVFVSFHLQFIYADFVCGMFRISLSVSFSMYSMCLIVPYCSPVSNIWFEL